MMHNVLVAGFVFLGAYSGVGLMIRWTLRHNVLDVPNERSSHARPVPTGGGLPIIVAVLTGMSVLQSLAPSLPPPAFLASVGLISAVALLGWCDDRKPLSSTVRLLIQSIIALTALFVFGRWTHISLPIVGELSLGWFGLAVSFLWMVGMMNAYNFMDGIDGLAGGQAMVAGAFWLIVGIFAANPFVTSMGVVIVASAIGFMFYNWAPAKIFMGDVGSVTLGFLFAFAPLACSTENTRIPLAAALVVWPFLFDTIFTVFRRLRHGEDLFSAHRSHLYQRLTISGLSHPKVTALYLILSVIGGVLGFLWLQNSPGAEVSLLLVPLLCVALWMFVNHRETKHLVDKSSEAIRRQFVELAQPTIGLTSWDAGGSVFHPGGGRLPEQQGPAV